MRDSRSPNYHCAIFKCPLAPLLPARKLQRTRWTRVKAMSADKCARKNPHAYSFLCAAAAVFILGTLTVKLMLKIFLIEVDHETTPRANYLRNSAPIQRISEHYPLNSNSDNHTAYNCSSLKAQ